MYLEIVAKLPFVSRIFAVFACGASLIFFIGLLVTKLVNRSGDIFDTVLIIFIVVAAYLVVAALQAGVFLRIRGKKIVLGLRPLTRISFDVSQVRQIEVIDFPMLQKDWGVRGKINTEQGRIYAVQEHTQALLFTLQDDRRVGISIAGETQEIISLTKYVKTNSELG